MLTLETYAHAMREEEADLSFADFGPIATGPIGPRNRVSDVAIRRYPSLDSAASPGDENGPELTARSRYEFLERESGFGDYVGKAKKAQK
jgi:hypothetical protein